jgi:hypothetical protein
MEELVAALLVVFAVGGVWFLGRLVWRAEREARDRARTGVGARPDLEEASPNEDEDEATRATRFSEALLSLPLRAPPPTSDATSWMMNQGPPQFGLMPEPGAVSRLMRQVDAVTRTSAPEARALIVESAVEVLLRSVEWRRAEEVHHLLIHVLGELGDEGTLPVLDALAAERSFDDDEKKALAQARRRIDARLEARRGRLAMANVGGELGLVSDRE